MSLILEALKKSERQRRLGEMPSIGSPVIVVRRRRSLLPLLVGLIAVALAVGWWLRRGNDTPAETPAPVAQAPAPAPEAPAPAAPATGDGPSFDMSQRSAASGQARERVASQAATRAPVSKVPPDANAGMPADVRKRVESGDLVVANPNLLKPGQPSTIETAAPADAPAVPPSADRPAGRAVAEPVEAKYFPPGTKPAQAPEEPATRTANAPAPAAGSPIPLLWELPYAQRRDVPELKVSMHVYAAEPASRFVIVNGERRAEGEDFEGVRLVEIRNDGIVLERQGVRFLYPRGGR